MKTNEKTSLKKGTISYTDKEENHIIKRRKKTLKTNVKIIICDIFILLLMVVSLYLFKLGSNVMSSETPKVSYALSGKTDYKVKLKKNDYYKEEYLKSGMQYISSLIDTIDIDFEYEAHASEKVDYEYKYNVSATTLVSSKTDKSKIIFENSEELVKNKKVEVKDKSFVINDVIQVDYDMFNDYVIKYKKEYALNTLFDLVVKIHVDTCILSEISDTLVKDSKDFEIVIPLSEQIIDITPRTKTYENSGIISGSALKTAKVKLYYGIGLVSLLIAVVLLIDVLVMIIKNNKKKSIYNKVIEKYLREYDRAIVITHNSSINENDYEQVIGISSIEEMLDLHDNYQVPILYYEVVKDVKSYFIIIKDNILYKLTISRKKLEENNGEA